MINIRPRMIKPIPWPWKNKIDDRGFPVVVEHAEHGMMPELVSCFDWEHWERQPIEYLSDWRFTMSRDLKSVFTTAVRMYGMVGLYEHLRTGNNVFMPIAYEMARWARMVDEIGAIDGIVIGDDIAHATNLLFPPDLLEAALIPAWSELRFSTGYNLTVFHSDGDISSFIPAIERGLKPEHYVIQASLNDNMREAVARYGIHCTDHTAPDYNVSLPTKEEWNGTTETRGR